MKKRRSINLVWGIVLALVIGASSCKTSSNFTTPQGEQIVAAQKKVAVLPFAVTFSDDYKELRRDLKQPWEEQGRVAGIDLQKSAFESLAKRSNKKNWGLMLQDYTLTNKKLLEAQIGYSDMLNADKAQLAQILGVDAVIFGRALVDFQRMGVYMGNNGIKTRLELYDNRSGAKVWEDSDKEYIRSRFDSPQDLGRRSVSGLINSLPYKAGGK